MLRCDFMLTVCESLTSQPVIWCQDWHQNTATPAGPSTRFSWPHPCPHPQPSTALLRWIGRPTPPWRGPRTPAWRRAANTRALRRASRTVCATFEMFVSGRFCFAGVVYFSRLVVANNFFISHLHIFAMYIMIKLQLSQRCDSYVPLLDSF